MVPRRLIFLGLDGVGLNLASSLASRGVMPHLGRLLEAGRAWSTQSPLPEVSPVCWTSMFSGQGPGGHGIYGFARAGGGLLPHHPLRFHHGARPPACGKGLGAPGSPRWY